MTPCPAGSPPCTCRAARASASTPTPHPARAIPPHYDSLVGKVIAHGASRAEALARARAALAELRVEGVQHQRRAASCACCRIAGFERAAVDIHHLERLLAGEGARHG
jgi:biotin carboxylase